MTNLFVFFSMLIGDAALDDIHPLLHRGWRRADVISLLAQMPHDVMQRRRAC